MQIRRHTVVAIRYKMQNGRGEVLEDILEGSPVEYLHGGGALLPALEDHLAGLVTGDKKKVFISSADGIPGMEDDFSFDVVVDAVREATETEIRMGCPKDEVEAGECSPGCIC